MRVVPYTTESGLQIGCRYMPPKRIEYLSRDASLLQSALMLKPTNSVRRARSWPIVRAIYRWL